MIQIRSTQSMILVEDLLLRKLNKFLTEHCGDAFVKLSSSERASLIIAARNNAEQIGIVTERGIFQFVALYTFLYSDIPTLENIQAACVSSDTCTADDMIALIYEELSAVIGTP